MAYITFNIFNSTSGQRLPFAFDRAAVNGMIKKLQALRDGEKIDYHPMTRLNGEMAVMTPKRFNNTPLPYELMFVFDNRRIELDMSEEDFDSLIVGLQQLVDGETYELDPRFFSTNGDYNVLQLTSYKLVNPNALN